MYVIFYYQQSQNVLHAYKCIYTNIFSLARDALYIVYTGPSCQNVCTCAACLRKPGASEALLQAHPNNRRFSGYKNNVHNNNNNDNSNAMQQINNNNNNNLQQQIQSANTQYSNNVNAAAIQQLQNYPQALPVHNVSMQRSQTTQPSSNNTPMHTALQHNANISPSVTPKHAAAVLAQTAPINHRSLSLPQNNSFLNLNLLQNNNNNITDNEQKMISPVAKAIEILPINNNNSNINSPNIATLAVPVNPFHIHNSSKSRIPSLQHTSSSSEASSPIYSTPNTSENDNISHVTNNYNMHDNGTMNNINQASLAQIPLQHQYSNYSEHTYNAYNTHNDIPISNNLPTNTGTPQYTDNNIHTGQYSPMTTLSYKMSHTNLPSLLDSPNHTSLPNTHPYNSSYNNLFQLSSDSNNQSLQQMYYTNRYNHSIENLLSLDKPTYSNDSMNGNNFVSNNTHPALNNITEEIDLFTQQQNNNTSNNMI